MLLGLIIEQVTGAPIAEVLRSGVLVGDGYERLISQPDERPTDPMALPFGAPADTFDDLGGYLPTLAGVTAVEFEGGMASDSLSLARWWRGLCSGQVVAPASLDEMTDFDKRPGYGLGIMDRSGEYSSDSGALGHGQLQRIHHRRAVLPRERKPDIRLAQVVKPATGNFPKAFAEGQARCPST
jgi:CubicO group peptidase (beta-lactamase class C family)